VKVTQSSNNSEALKGLLICPFNSGYIEFEYLRGDFVKELKERIHQVWGHPDSRNTDYWAKNSWALFCKCKDGSYSMLIDSDLIPTSPPSNGGVLDAVHAEWAKRPLREISESEGVGEGRFDPMIAGAVRMPDYWQERRVRMSINAAEANGSISYEEILAGRHRNLRLTRGLFIPDDRLYSVEILALIAVVGG